MKLNMTFFIGIASKSQPLGEGESSSRREAAFLGKLGYGKKKNLILLLILMYYLFVWIDRAVRRSLAIFNCHPPS